MRVWNGNDESLECINQIGKLSKRRNEGQVVSELME